MPAVLWRGHCAGVALSRWAHDSVWIRSAVPMSTILTPDLCIIGAGSGGLSVAAAAAAFGVSVVLLERARMGGECLNYGCVPSKALIAAASRSDAIRRAAAFGLRAGSP